METSVKFARARGNRVRGRYRVKEKKKGPWWLIGLAGAFLLAQAKTLLSFLQFGKLGLTLVTMLISIGAYTLIAPFELAVGAAFLLLVHELGHVAAARKKGLPVSAVVFIPFIGAMITMKRHPRDAETEALIAISGPLAGTLASAAAYAVGIAGVHPLWIAIANVGFLFNLLNLLPIKPLDGGRIAVAVTRWLWLAGLVAGIFVIFYWKSYLLLGLWFVFAYDLFRKYLRRQSRKDRITAWTHIRIPRERVTPELRRSLEGTVHRDLPFTTFSDLRGRQKVVFRWDEIGLKEEVKLPRQMIVHRVAVVKAGQHEKQDSLQMTVRCRMECEAYDSDVYYNVPARKRWGFGAVYAGLILFLMYMLYVVNGTWLIRLV